MGAQGGREVIQTIARRTGNTGTSTAHELGRAKTIVEALGWAYLPPSAGSHIKRRRLAVEPKLAAA